jgi:hypothetical protein
MTTTQRPPKKQLTGKCRWLETVKHSTAKWQFLAKQPRIMQLEQECADTLEKKANAEKENIETKCAWLRNLRETGSEDEIRAVQAEPWYPGLEETCSVIPSEEMEDNLVNILKQKCVWLEMADLSGKLAGQRDKVWYGKLKAQCESNGSASRAKAAAVLSRVKGAVGMAETLFGGAAGGRGGEAAEQAVLV